MADELTTWLDRGKPCRSPRRPLTCFELEIVETPTEGVVDEFGLRILCGSGTYIRSLGRDLARCLGSSAVMSDLRRTRLGPFDLSMTIEIDSITNDTPMIECEVATADLPAITLTAAQAKAVSHGNAVRLSPSVESETYRLMTESGRLLAVAEPTHLGLQPRVVLKEALEQPNG